MKKSTIAMTAAAAATVSLFNTVGAEEVAPKPVNVEAPKAEVVETTTPAVATKEEVATKEAEAKKADQDVVEAKQAVKDAKRATNEADSLVNEKTEAVKKAEDFAKKASPAVITEAEKAVVKAESAVPAKAEAVKNAETKATEASQAVSAQEAVVAGKEATQTAKEKALTSATEAVQIATDAARGKGLENAKEAQKEAVEAEKTSKQAQTDAETALKEAETANQATKAQIEDTKAEIATKTQAVSDAKAEQEKADKAVTDLTAEYNQAVSALKAIQNTKQGTITLAPKFIEAVKARVALLKAVENGEYNDRLDEVPAKFKETRAEILKTQLENAQINHFVPVESDSKDTKKYDLNNLPEDFKRDLTLYAADLTNQMRRQLGLSDVKVTEDSFHFADKIAREYEKDGVTPELLDSYRAKKNGHGHYAIGINKVAKEYGLNDGMSETDRKEGEGRGLQSYENSVNFIETNPKKKSELEYLTKSEIRTKLYESLVMFVSTENDYGHTRGTLGFEKGDTTLYYGGFGASQVAGMYTLHTVPGIPETFMANSTFSRTEVENPYTKARDTDSVKKAEALVATKKAEKAQAEETLKTANQTVVEAETALQTANSNLKSQEAQLKDTVALKETLQSATTSHNQAVVALSNANALVATLSATKADKEAKLAELKATAQEAEKEFNQAKAETKAEKATLSSLQAKAEEATQAVSVAKEALDQAKAQVVSSKELVQDLKVAAKELETRKAELKDAEEALKVAQVNQATAQEALEAKEKVAKEASKAYATAKASYEAEELKKHPVTEKGIPEVRPALPEFVLPTTPRVPSVPVAPVAPVVPTTPRVEVPVVNNNGGVSVAPTFTTPSVANVASYTRPVLADAVVREVVKSVAILPTVGVKAVVTKVISVVPSVATKSAEKQSAVSMNGVVHAAEVKADEVKEEASKVTEKIQEVTTAKAEVAKQAEVKTETNIVGRVASIFGIFALIGVILAGMSVHAKKTTNVAEETKDAE